MMEATTQGEEAVAGVLGAIQEIESDADAIVSRAQREGQDLLARAGREAEGRRTSAAQLAGHEAEIALQAALVEAQKEAESLRSAARSRTQAQRDAVARELPAAVEEIIERVLPAGWTSMAGKLGDKRASARVGR